MDQSFITPHVVTLMAQMNCIHPDGSAVVGKAGRAMHDLIIQRDQAKRLNG